MTSIKEDLFSELRMLAQGKTLDAIFPALGFVLFQRLWGLQEGALLAVVLAVVLFGYRVVRKEKKVYALFGVLGVLVSAFLSYTSGAPETFFLPRLLTSFSMVLLSFGSVFLGRPLAAYLSHISRGWPLAWFFRQDVKPAYREVTLVWSLLLLVRFLLQMAIYQGGRVSEIFFLNFLLGTPATLLVLMGSYLYGVKRLHSLKGPSVEEFQSGKKPPYVGQRKGF